MIVRQTSTPVNQRVLCFDMETFAAGFADPEWVPQKITCIAWAFLGETVRSTIPWGGGMGPQQAWWTKEGRRNMMLPFDEALRQAEVLTGHNIARFDLRVWNAECLRVGIEPFRGPVIIRDTMRLVGNPKGYKKGLDNIAVALGAEEHKIPLNWQEWDDAYEDPTWATVIDRCESDVVLQSQVLEKMDDRDLLRADYVWEA